MNNSVRRVVFCLIHEIKRDKLTAYRHINMKMKSDCNRVEVEMHKLD